MLKLVLRNLAYYRRTNAAVVFGVGVAVAVLAGALLVGESVRASLRGLFLQRLGRATHVASAPNFFREALAADLGAGAGFREAGFDAACPLVIAEGRRDARGERPPRCGGAGLRRGRALLGVPRPARSGGARAAAPARRC